MKQAEASPEPTTTTTEEVGECRETVAEEAGAEKEREDDKSELLAERRRASELARNLQYLQADFENYRKRMDRRVKEAEETANARLVRGLLSILDELELAVANAEAGGENGAVLDGIKMVYKGLLSRLEDEGLRRIESVGKLFDPSLHEAVEKVGGDEESVDEKSEAIVVEELRAGYIFRDRVIRPSMVKVKLGSQNTTKAEATNENE